MHIECQTLWFTSELYTAVDFLYQKDFLLKMGQEEVCMHTHWYAQPVCLTPQLERKFEALGQYKKLSETGRD